jgi:hypothetical protein
MVDPPIVATAGARKRQATINRGDVKRQSREREEDKKIVGTPSQFPYRVLASVIY